MLSFYKVCCYLKIIVKQYNYLRMFVAFKALNNITTHKHFTAYSKILLDFHYYQITNNFEKLLEQEIAKNTLKVVTPIFLTISIYFGLTRLLKVDFLNAKYD